VGNVLLLPTYFKNGVVGKQKDVCPPYKDFKNGVVGKPKDVCPPYKDY
jgi:ribosome modulation factor